MKRVTLYWDDGSFGVFYYNGTRWRFRAHSRPEWRDCIVQDWSPSDFDKSLTVNNFKEK